MSPGLAGSSHVAPLEAEANGTGQTLVPYRLYWPGHLPCSASFILYVGSFRLGGVLLYMFKLDWSALMTPQKANLDSMRTANNFGLMYSRKRISQNSFPNLSHIIPKSLMVFCQELHNLKRKYENQI